MVISYVGRGVCVFRNQFNLLVIGYMYVDDQSGIRLVSLLKLVSILSCIGFGGLERFDLRDKWWLPITVGFICLFGSLAYNGT